MNSTYLPHRDTTHTGVQNARVGVGAHFAYKREPLPPANGVLVDFFSVGERTKIQDCYFRHMLKSVPD